MWISGGRLSPEIDWMYLLLFDCPGFTPGGWLQIAWQKPYLSSITVSLHSPLPFSGETPPDFINALIRKWGLEFLFANKQISLCIEVAPPLLPLSPAAGEAGRKFSMKQRRHAARWLASGAQGHWCWLEKANAIFYWSIHFHSKFGEVKHPDRSKYSPFIPINNVASIFARIVWTKNIKHGLCWSGVNLLTEHFQSKYPSHGQL